MKVRFLKVEAKNFMSFERLDFKFNDKGLYLILGEVESAIASSNGAGKSSIAECLVFALFGKTLRGVSPDSVIRRGADYCEVSVIFQKGEEEFQVYRTRNHPVRENSVEFRNITRDVDLTGSKQVETNARIVSELGFSFDIFKNAVCYGQGLPSRFVQATDAEKKKVFDEILALGWVADCRQRAFETKKEYLTEKSSLELELYHLRSDIEALEARRKNLFNKSPSHSNHKKELERVRKELSNLKKKVEEVEDAMEKIEAEVFERSGFVAALKAECSSIAAKLRANQKEINNLREELAQWKKVVGKPCAVCKRVIDSETAVEVRKTSESRLESLLAGQGALEEEIRIKENELVESQASFGRVEEKLRAFREIKRKLDKKVRSLEVEEAQLLTDMKAEKRRVEEKKKEQAEIDRLIDDLKAKEAKINHRLSVIDSVIEGLDFWLVGFSNRGIRTLVLENVLPFLNQASENYSQFLVDGEVRIEFKNYTTVSSGETRERFVVETSSLSGVEYSQSSGGEKRKIDVIVLLALHDLISYQTGVDTNIQIFDEVFENLDDSGSERLLSLLKSRAEERGVYVISHNFLIGDFDGEIRVFKSKDGVSTIKQIGGAVA